VSVYVKRDLNDVNMMIVMEVMMLGAFCIFFVYSHMKRDLIVFYLTDDYLRQDIRHTHSSNRSSLFDLYAASISHLH